MSIKYNFEERESWIKTFQPNYEEQKWHTDKVYHPSEIDNIDFFTPYRNYDSLINPKQIIGIDYAYGYNCPSYGKKDIDWKYMLKWLKRLDRVIDNFKDKESLIEHIHKDRDPKSVLKYGNHYFTTSGQHRLCLAKYLEVEQVKVYVTEYKLDKSLFTREKYLEKYYHKLVDYGFLKGEYKKELKNDLIHINISDKTILIHKSLIKYIVHRYELLKEKKHKAFSNILKTLYKPKDNNTYKNINELYTLDNILIKHILIKGSS